MALSTEPSREQSSRRSLFATGAYPTASALVPPELPVGSRRYTKLRRSLFAAGVALFLCFGGAPAIPQESAEDTSAPAEMAPFVSGLRVAVQDPRVRLTWRDGSDDASLQHIYRATVEITDETFDRAREVGTVRAGVETFLDVPEEAGSYFYAVLSETGGGEIRNVFLPFRNKTTQPVSISAVGSEVEPPANMISVSLERRGDEIVLRFRADRPGRKLGIYRSTEAVDSLDALARAARIAIVDSSRRSYRDVPIPGIAYYYAVIDTEQVAAGEISFSAGANVSETAVQLPLELVETTRSPAEEQAARRRPLPFLMIDETLQSGSALVSSPLRLTGDRQPVQEETLNAVDAALAQARDRADQAQVESAAPQPRVLKEERITDAKGPRYTLQTIAEGPFSDGRWRESIRLLENMLTISLPPDVEARAHFYLGQARYFAGERRRAFLDFVLARERYYLETKDWIDRLVRELHDEEPS